jgi:phosphohistidine phosphatase
MELILWRHADAEDGPVDLQRKLTAKGRRDAEKVAGWLLKRLPKDFRLVASPAVRAQQTAEALKAKIETDRRLAPGASVDDILEAAGRGGTVVLVGHQPDLGEAIAHLLRARSIRLQKGALWWLADDLVRAVVSPDLL